MKKTYIQPANRIISLYPEDTYLTETSISVSDSEVDTDDEGFEQRTQGNRIWGSDAGIWK